MINQIKLKYEKNILWLSLLKYIGVALLLAYVSILLDTVHSDYLSVLPPIFLSSISLARQILSTLVMALLSITTFTFSTTMVVLTMYSSQFSPRVVQNFLKDRLTLKVLGIFLGGFFYAVVTLFFMKEDLVGKQVISATIGIIYALLAIVYFVLFIFKVSSSIQSSNLITKLYHEAKDSIENIITHNHDTVKIDEYFTHEYPFHFNITSKSSGYVQTIGYQNFLNALDFSDYFIVIHIRLGEFVVKGQKIATLYKHTAFSEDIDISMNQFILLDEDRNHNVDYIFSIEKLVDVALRAIAPGVNDPNTARYCINMLGMLMSTLSTINGNYCFYKNEAQNGKICYPVFDFDHTLMGTFQQIIFYGKSDLSVVLSLFQAFKSIKLNASQANKQEVDFIANYLYEKATCMTTNEYELKKLKDTLEEVLSK